MPHAVDRADLIGLTLSHSMLRNELPRLAAALSGRPVSPDEEPVVEDHLRLVTDHLRRHHQEEEAFHWPLLASRAPGAARLLALLTAERTQLDPLIVRVRRRDVGRSERATALSRLTELVLDQLEEEDRSVVPLLMVHVTREEQRDSMARSRATIPPADELRVLAMMHAAADENERSRMLSPLPDAVVTRCFQHEGPALRAVHRLLADVSDQPHPSTRNERRTP